MAENVASRWYSPIKGDKWHKALVASVPGNGNDWRVSTYCGREMRVGIGIEKAGCDLPVSDKCHNCMRLGGEE